MEAMLSDLTLELSQELKLEVRSHFYFSESKYFIKEEVTGLSFTFKYRSGYSFCSFKMELPSSFPKTIKVRYRRNFLSRLFPNLQWRINGQKDNTNFKTKLNSLSKIYSEFTLSFGESVIFKTSEIPLDKLIILETRLEILKFIK